jgi:hypothetical protein
LILGRRESVIKVYGLGCLRRWKYRNWDVQIGRDKQKLMKTSVGGVSPTGMHLPESLPQKRLAPVAQLPECVLGLPEELG